MLLTQYIKIQAEQIGSQEIMYKFEVSESTGPIFTEDSPCQVRDLSSSLCFISSKPFGDDVMISKSSHNDNERV